MLVRVVAALVLLVFAAGIAVEACSLSGAGQPAPSSGQPGAQPTIVIPDASDEQPSATIEVPPPID